MGLVSFLVYIPLMFFLVEKNDKRNYKENSFKNHRMLTTIHLKAFDKNLDLPCVE